SRQRGRSAAPEALNPCAATGPSARCVPSLRACRRRAARVGPRSSAHPAPPAHLRLRRSAEVLEIQQGEESMGARNGPTDDPAAAGPKARGTTAIGSVGAALPTPAIAHGATETSKSKTLQAARKITAGAGPRRHLPT